MGRNAPTRASAREWIGLAVLALACVLYSMDLTVLYLAVPRLSEDLRPSSAQLLWIIDIYGFFVAGSLITMGTLGDRIGRRRLLLIGAAAFGIASVLAAFSRSAEMLIAARGLMGVAGATLAPSTLSLVFNMFLDSRQRAVAVGVVVSCFSVGAAIGPTLGGILLEFFWWGSVFLLSLPVMALLLLLGPRVLPEFRATQARRLDVLSAVMSLAAILFAIYGLKQIAQDGLSVVSVFSIISGALIAVSFVRRQSGLAEPLIDLGLFRMTTFSAALTIYMLNILAMFGYVLLVPQYLQLVLGLSPLQAGLWSIPFGLGFIVGSMLSSRLARRLRPAHLMTGGLLVASLAVLSLTLVGTSPDGLPIVVIAQFVGSIGFSPMFTLTPELVIGAAPPERAGVASGIYETSSELGGALGIAILGSVGTAVYRSRLSDQALVGVPRELAESARDTLGGAIHAASQLPGPAGTALLEMTRSAFVDAMHLVAVIGVAVALVVAVIVQASLRHVPSSGSATKANEPVAASQGEGVSI